MDDNLSIKSSDSVTISGEYEIVNEDIEPQPATLDAVSPALKIANNGNHVDLEKNLTEMIYESDPKPIERSVATESGKYPRILSSSLLFLCIFSLFLLRSSISNSLPIPFNPQFGSYLALEISKFDNPIGSLKIH